MKRIDDLQTQGLRIVQDPDLFCFSTDAVLLADFAAVHPGDSVVDLGAASGVLDLLMYARQPRAKYFALEIQKPLYALLEQSVDLNGLRDFIHPRLGDIKNAADFFGRSNHAVVCNPPYEKISHGKGRRARTHDIARKEILITLREICEAAASLLRFGGRFYLCCRPARLSETMSDMSDLRVEPKLLRLCKPRTASEPSLCLIMGKKGARPGLRILPDLVLRNADGNETEEVRRIYNRERNDEY